MEGAAAGCSAVVMKAPERRFLGVKGRQTGRVPARDRAAYQRRPTNVVETMTGTCPEG
jgi:hypothetical protein